MVLMETDKISKDTVVIKNTASMMNTYLLLEIGLMPEKLLHVPILCNSFRPVV